MGDESVGSAAKIEELKEKFQKDPGSRIFVQLAEEYRRVGRFDEAIAVCLAGLEKHPAYSSARVTLARAYHGAKRLDDAKAEFEKVITAVPDNLLANRHLGDLYYDEGRSLEALERYRVVQMLSPADDEVTSRIARLEGGAGSGAELASALPEALPEPEDELGAFMDLRIDESVILNADMVAAALKNAGASGALSAAVPAPPPVAVPPPIAARRPDAAAPSGAGVRAPDAFPPAPVLPDEGGDELGMGVEDFSDFSSPTVMLNAADLAKMAGLADEKEAVDRPTLEPPKPTVATSPAPVPAGAAPATGSGDASRGDLPSYAARTAAKFGISRYSGPDPEPPRGARPTAPPPQMAPGAAAPRPDPSGAQAAGAGAPPAPPAPAAPAAAATRPEMDEPDELGGAMDDFAEFASPTVMMNVSDLLKAAGVSAEGGTAAAGGRARSAAVVQEPTPLDTPIASRAGFGGAAPIEGGRDAVRGAVPDELEALGDSAALASPEQERLRGGLGLGGDLGRDGLGDGASAGEEPVFGEDSSFAEASTFEDGGSPANLFSPDYDAAGSGADMGTRAIPLEELAALKIPPRGSPGGSSGAALVSRPASPESAGVGAGDEASHPPAAPAVEEEPLRPVSLLGDDDEDLASISSPLGEAPGSALLEDAFAAEDFGAESGPLETESTEDLRTMAFGSAEAEAAHGPSLAESNEDMRTMAFGSAEAHAAHGPFGSMEGHVESVAPAPEHQAHATSEPQPQAIDWSSRTLGQAYLEQGRLEEALASFEKYLVIDPEDAEIRRQVAALRGRMEAPVGAARAAADLDHRSPLASPAPDEVGGGTGLEESSVADGSTDSLMETPEERKKKIERLSTWLSSLKKT